MIKRRSKALRDLGRAKKAAFYSGFVGRLLPVLMEGGGMRGVKGTTPNYVTVRVEDADLRPGDEIMARISAVRGEEALGVVEAV